MAIRSAGWGEWFVIGCHAGVLEFSCSSWKLEVGGWDKCWSLVRIAPALLVCLFSYLHTS